MTRKGLIMLTTIVLLGTSCPGRVSADVRRERPSRRPYITEVGYPYAINASRLRYEIQHLSALREYIQEYGYPDYAEVQEILPEWPWLPYEVRLYYLQRNVEADFSPVLLSPAFPEFGVLKFRGDMTPEKRHEIELVLQSRTAPAAPAPVRVAPPPARTRIEELVERVEAATERAEQAADRAAAASEAAARAANRTVNIVDKMEENAGTRH